MQRRRLLSLGPAFAALVDLLRSNQVVLELTIRTVNLCFKDDDIARLRGDPAPIVLPEAFSRTVRPVLTTGVGLQENRPAGEGRRVARAPPAKRKRGKGKSGRDEEGGSDEEWEPEEEG